MTSLTTQHPLPYASIADISVRLRERRLSPLALAEECLARIRELNPVLNAFITVTADLAREQARSAYAEIRAGDLRGPLHGVPMAVKDFYDTAGIRTTAAFEGFKERTPQEDAQIVRELREAGAVLVGKTNMHRLGMGTTSLESSFGPVVNPHSPEYVAGGSSGGSAAAVAAGLCFASVDTDAVGSGRLPAAICGLTCLKPTFGALSMLGILAGESTNPAILALGHGSLMARSAEDVALAFRTLRVKERAASALSPRRPVRRIGIVRNCRATTDIQQVFARTVAAFGAMGLEMLEVQVPFEAASFDVSRIDRDRAEINASLFRDADLIVLPTQTARTPSVSEARSQGEMAVSPENTFFCNYYGLPAVSLPMMVAPDDLPLGFQIVGPQGEDERVLSVACMYQLATNWRYTPPKLG